MMTWMPSEQVDAQTAHVLAGWGTVGWACLLGWPLSLTWAVLLGWVAMKEYWFDLRVEQDSVKSSTIDAAFYVLGGIAGTLMLKLVVR